MGHGPPEPAPTDGRSPLSSSSPHCIPNVGRSSFEAAGHLAVFEQRPESHSVLHIECNSDENHVRLQEHGDEHSFSLQFSAFCAKVLGLRTLRTELVYNGQTTVHQFPALFQERVFRLTQWLERWGNSLEATAKTGLGYYLLGLLGSILLSKVRPPRLRQHESGRQIVRSTCLRTGPLRLGIVDKGIWRLSCTHKHQSDVRVARKGLGSLVPRALTGVPGHVLQAGGFGSFLPFPK